MSFCHVDFQATATTQALFDQVVKYLELTEKFFFGLTQLQGRMHFKIPVEKNCTYKQQNCGVLADWITN